MCVFCRGPEGEALVCLISGWFSSFLGWNKASVVAYSHGLCIQSRTCWLIPNIEFIGSVVSAGNYQPKEGVRVQGVFWGFSLSLSIPCCTLIWNYRPQITSGQTQHLWTDCYLLNGEAATSAAGVIFGPAHIAGGLCQTIPCSLPSPGITAIGSHPIGSCPLDAAFMATAIQTLPTASIQLWTGAC